MDEFETDNNSLLEFINNKCNDIEELDYKKITSTYNKCLKTALSNVYAEQKNFNYCISCSELISDIFKIIYNYSNNLKLALFICERSTLLFNEYLNISKNYSSEKINLSDVKQFIINKSIGPIINKKCNSLSEIIPILDLMKIFIIKIFIKINKIDNELYVPNKLEFLENTIDILSNSMTNICLNGYISYLEVNLDNIYESEDCNLSKNINLLKINLEIFLYAYQKKKMNYINCKELVLFVLNEKQNLIEKYYDIENLFNPYDEISEKIFYKNLLNLIE